MTPLLEVAAVSKSYGTTAVLQDVSLSVAPGEIVSIIGENGAGKSTLAKIIAGITAPSAGTIRWSGDEVMWDSPGDAIARGIGIVHQEISLVDTLSIAENISLGREPTRRGLLDQSTMGETAQRALARLHSDLQPHRKVGSLSSAQKQMVEIARALSYDARLLIFDEPTSSLSEQEGQLLLEIIKRLRDSEVSILYVSHRLPEVQRISDRVVALRDGRVSGELPARQLSRDALISLIVGREIKDIYGYAPRTIGDEILTLADFQATSWHRPCSFSVRAGEIVGLAGLIGSGRTELLEAIYGLTPPAGGSVRIHGAPCVPSHPSEARASGISLLPESRKEHGIIASFPIQENIALSMTTNASRRGLRSRDNEQRQTIEYISSLGVRCTGPDQPIGELSGGNQQKVVLAKCLVSSPTVLLLDEPTRGVDVGARREIYSLLFSLAARGMGILFVSSELEEVLGIADRIVVMSEGSVTGTLVRNNFSEHAVMTLAAHHSQEAA